MMRPPFLAALLLIAGCAMPPETSAPNAAGDERPVEHREVLAAAPAADAMSHPRFDARDAKRLEGDLRSEIKDAERRGREYTDRRFEAKHGGR